MFQISIAFDQNLKYIKACLKSVGVLVTLQGLIKYSFGADYHREGILFIIEAIVFPVAIVYYIKTRQNNLFQRFLSSMSLNKFPKMEESNIIAIRNFISNDKEKQEVKYQGSSVEFKATDYEQVFTMIINLAKECYHEFQIFNISTKHEIFEQQGMKKLICLIENHIQGCDKIDCLCEIFEDYCSIFGKQVNNNEVKFKNQKILKQQQQKIDAALNYKPEDKIILRLSKYQKIYDLLNHSSENTLSSNNLCKMLHSVYNFNSDEISQSSGDISIQKSLDGFRQIKQEYQKQFNLTKQLRVGQNLPNSQDQFFELDYQFAYTYFIINYLKLILDEIKAKNPLSKSIDKPHLAIISLRKNGVNMKQSHYQGTSWMELVQDKIHEHLILHYFNRYIFNTQRIHHHSEKDPYLNILKIDNKNGCQDDFQNQQSQNFIPQTIQINADKFIVLSTQYTKFHNDLELLSQSAFQFWQGFADENLDPFKQINIGENLSKIMKRIYSQFIKIEDSLVQKDPKLYFWFGLIQLKIVNDENAYNLFIAKMKEIHQFQKAIVRDINLKKFDQESGFIVADARIKTQGSIYMMNKILLKLIKRNDSELKRMSINDIMPESIGSYHQNFMAKYNETGESKILNKKRTLFIKDSNQSLIPINFFVQFHYSYQYGYCFVCLIDVNQNLKPFNDNLSYGIDELVFMSFDCRNGQIQECSDNFSQLLSYHSQSNQRNVISYHFKEKSLSIDDIFENLNFNNRKFDLLSNIQSFLNQSSNVNHQSKNLQEGVFKINVLEFNDEFEFTNDDNPSSTEIYAKLSMYIEQFGSAKIQIGFLVLCLDQSTVFNQKFESSISDNEDNQNKIADLRNQNLQLLDIMNQRDNQEQKHNLVLSSSGGGSSTSSTENTSFDIKSFHTFYQQNTPRILKLVVQLMVVMFLSSFIIATINLVLNIQNSNSSTLDFQSVKASYDRINYTINLRIMLRVLSNIGQGYEPSSSFILADRFSNYKEILSQRLSELKDTDYDLDNSGYKFSSDFQSFIDGDTVPLIYLNNQNQIYFQNSTMSIAQNLLISRYTQISNFSIQQFQSKIKVFSLTAPTNVTYSPTQDEQSLYFALNNSNWAIRYNNEQLEGWYASEALSQADDRIKQSIILAVVSVVTILIITLLISPIVSKTEERKFYALQFFIKLPQDKIQFFQSKCENCFDIQTEKDLNQKYKSYTINFDDHGLNNSITKLDLYQDSQLRESKAGISLYDNNESSINQNSIQLQFEENSEQKLQSPIRQIRQTYKIPPLFRRMQTSTNGTFNNKKQTHSNQNVIQEFNDKVVKMKPDLSLKYIPNQAAFNSQNLSNFKNPDQSLVISQSIRDQIDHYGLNNSQSLMLEAQEANNKDKITSFKIKKNKEMFSIPEAKEQNQNKPRKSILKEDRKPIQRKSLKEKAFSSINERIHLSQNSKSQNTVSQKKSIIISEENIQIKNTQDEKQEQLQLINRLAVRQRVKILVIITLLISIFVQYFIVTMVLQIQKYQESKYAISDLQLVFNKESCFEDLLGFNRGDSIQNKTELLSLTQHIGAVNYLMTLCQDRESQYNIMRRQLPIYFQDAKPMMDVIDSDQLCDYFFQAGTQYSYLQNICKNVQNGILTKGITNANAYFYLEAQKYRSSLEQAWDTKTATVDFLKSLLNNSEMINIIDIKMIVLAQPFALLKNACQQSVITYFNSQKNILIIIYSIFVAITILSTFYFLQRAMQRLKINMWNTNLMLKIIPQDILSKEDSDLMKSFFVS